MFHRLVSAVLWLIVMLLITATAGVALFLSYRGLFSLCARNFQAGSISVGCGVMLGVASYLLCRHGNDLMDR